MFGNSNIGLPIVGYKWGSSAHKKVLILGGVHGDEVEGVVCALGLLKKWTSSFPFELSMTLVPQFNIEGVINKTRVNSRGVDLNRNLPTRDWNPQAFNERYPPGPFANSEVENQALTNWIENEKPDLIISLHSWKPLLNINGSCEDVAQVIQKHTGYSIEKSMGYPTPGCLGTYAGIERPHPTITYEIERGSSFQKILDLHLPAINEALKYFETR